MPSLDLKYKINIPKILIRIYIPEIQDKIRHNQNIQYRLPLRKDKHKFQLNLFN